jgi:hypothetical protein
VTVMTAAQKATATVTAIWARKREVTVMTAAQKATATVTAI